MRELLLLASVLTTSAILKLICRQLSFCCHCLQKKKKKVSALVLELHHQLFLGVPGRAAGCFSAVLTGTAAALRPRFSP